MTDRTSYERSLERSRAAASRPDRPDTFTMAGHEWDLLGDVFAPPYSATTETAMEVLGLTGEGPPLLPAGGSFLEVGSGTGIIAVMAALRGAGRVVATDINTYAVENTRRNAVRHRVEDRLTAVHSDLFAALDRGDRFDCVYWHSNFVLAPDEYRYRTDHERAYVDPGYRAHQRYLVEAPLRVTDGGAALLQFSDRGDLDRLTDLATTHGRVLKVLDRRAFLEGAETLEHILLEIRPSSV
ncbi:50S ribosomal protein L11 methyltransferase [Streptomyces sp. IMTB 2501]|uniref:50S ribosomal protein L11 methyltransferase n=1 Tax=Streptomyces sp. IMTB 2501 TaxID=1776340 RepID=UPI0009A1CA98|nr:50S ribosomal protein L11 methyltransferase [Streptomyces sp. IMTB 2501]